MSTVNALRRRDSEHPFGRTTRSAPASGPRLRCLLLGLLACIPLASETMAAATNDTPRAVLELAGVDESQFAVLSDGQPLRAEEEELLLKVLYRVRGFDWLSISRWTHRDVDLPALTASPETHRAEFFAIKGRVESVSAHELPGELVARFEMDKYYVCRLRLENDDWPVLVITTRIPRAWPVDAPLDERVSAQGLLLKVGAREDEHARPVFVARRLAWHPDTPRENLGVHLGMTILGDLGMDVGLLDDVVDRTRVTAREREAFYQMLWAAGRAGRNELVRHAANRKFSVVPLFNQPKEQRGRLVMIEGTARRAIKIHVGDASASNEGNRDIRERLAIDHYYEVEIFTEDSQNNPLVVCLRELPQGFPTGQTISERVRVAGFFFKSWAFQTQATGEVLPDGTVGRRRQLAPLLIGRAPLWIRPHRAERNPYLGLIAGGLFALCLAGIWWGLWRFSRGDRRFYREVIAKRYAVDEGDSLDPSRPGSQSDSQSDDSE